MQAFRDPVALTAWKRAIEEYKPKPKTPSLKDDRLQSQVRQLTSISRAGFRFQRRRTVTDTQYQKEFDAL